ncbi:hypothetical protein K461DRAFT_244565 [Myriangium duriaei CBS 260.36]|uniref:Mannose-1-phosphate guanyltransferase n=1 Tax=Myriangium duriaei CBS 260.36 TaxID=1168546 RepID=A0A9P4MKE9_9PEZI|nr:hypothetical protein K461DRAFT_244565 [Myriangium duriaei CBS 260.36]
MPHSTLPYSGFQAVILCGPGASLDTFTSNPKEFPKALLPIANRPMVWYPLDWCYRMGVTDITLITPPESAQAIESALAQNPHLTSLPAPKPEVIAPTNLTQVTGTGAIFRLPEVVKAIKSDFVVLPCDLVCELDGTSILQTWMTLEAGLGDARGGVDVAKTLGGEKSGRRGGLGVWYPTKGLEGISTKAEQTDFLATVPLQKSHPPPPQKSLQQDVTQLVMSMPMTTVKDVVEDKGALPIRHLLLKRHGNVGIKTTHRDAHVYFFPYWALQMMEDNEFDSVAEDVVGWWAKAGWQPGLGDKLGLRSILTDRPDSSDGDDMAGSMHFEEEIDLAGLSTTQERAVSSASSPQAASRVPAAIKNALTAKDLTIPPLLAYVQPSHTSAPDQPLIRRVDTSALLLSISLRLARLAPLSDPAGAAHPLAHAAKIAHPDTLHKQSRVAEADCLIAENVAVDARVAIKESVVGVGCSIGAGARITRCLLMDGCVVGEGVTLTGCILGRRCRVEAGKGKDDATRLTECEVAPGFVVEGGSKCLSFFYLLLVDLMLSYLSCRFDRRISDPIRVYDLVNRMTDSLFS